METKPTNNNYWLLRHGRSKANEAGIIVSKMENGVKPEYALADVGKEQAKAAGLLWKQQLGPDVDPATLLIVASPFSRTLETATLAGAGVGVSPDDASRFTTDAALRERDFGEYELQSHDLYERVWDGDAQSTAWAAPGGGESVNDVSARIAALFTRLETQHAGRNILLVAHGDTLSIATATAHGGGLEGHRSHAQETGELRRLVV